MVLVNDIQNPPVANQMDDTDRFLWALLTKDTKHLKKPDGKTASWSFAESYKTLCDLKDKKLAEYKAKQEQPGSWLKGKTEKELETFAKRDAYADFVKTNNIEDLIARIKKLMVEKNINLSSNSVLLAVRKFDGNWGPNKIESINQNPGLSSYELAALLLADAAKVEHRHKLLWPFYKLKDIVHPHHELPNNVDCPDTNGKVGSKEIKRIYSDKDIIDRAQKIYKFNLGQ
jgi:hypothetical protein